MTQLRIRLFGPFDIRLGEQTEPLHFPAKKTKALLGYLLLNRQTYHSRERLAGLWWGDRETSKARHCLNTEIWRLRQIIQPKLTRGSPFLSIGTEEVGFNLKSDYWLDIEQFERQCELAKQFESVDEELAGIAMQRAVGLYRDDLLPDCYEDWCLVERQRLQQLHLGILSRLANFHARRKEFAESISCYHRILANDPLREEAHRELIRLYAAAGQSSEAFRQFKDCADLLKQELGAEPMAETIALVRSLPQVFSQLQATRIVPSPRQLNLSDQAVDHELEVILRQMGVAAQTLALANLQFRNTLHQVEELVARLGGDSSFR